MIVLWCIAAILFMCIGYKLIFNAMVNSHASHLAREDNRPDLVEDFDRKTFRCVFAGMAFVTAAGFIAGRI